MSNLILYDDFSRADGALIDNIRYFDSTANSSGGPVISSGVLKPTSSTTGSSFALIKAPSVNIGMNIFGRFKMEGYPYTSGKVGYYIDTKDSSNSNAYRILIYITEPSYSGLSIHDIRAGSLKKIVSYDYLRRPSDNMYNFGIYRKDHCSHVIQVNEYSFPIYTGQSQFTKNILFYMWKAYETLATECHYLRLENDAINSTIFDFESPEIILPSSNYGRFFPFMT